MKNSDLLFKLERIVIDLVKVDGVDGGLIVDGTGKPIAKRMLKNIDVELFGPMANVITNSSKRLLSSSNQGEIHRVLVESINGKALFLNLENVHLIVLMKNHANIGLILVSSKRAAEKIGALSKDLKPDIVETIIEKEDEPSILELETDITSDDVKVIDSETLVFNESNHDFGETSIKKEQAILNESETIKSKLLDLKPESKDVNSHDLESAEIKELEHEDDITLNDAVTLKEDKNEEFKESIPIIKPPIAFPDIKKITEVPDDMGTKSELILDIYEAVFRAMSIGASKIMGVAPARGLTQKFLPSQECERLLNGVKVESNSTLNFDKIRDNAHKIQVENRESEFIEDFSKILDVITDNYGKVMGYEAFRGMVRPEFKKIADSYGPVMNKLGIINKMHPEISELFK